MTDTPKKVRHVLSLSGGKDSTALAIFMRDRLPDVEYVFCDTGEELQETYEYLYKLEAYLGKPIVRLNPDRPFSHYLDLYRGMLPDARTRWCTRMLKIKPFERYVKDDAVMSYIAIRADEPQRVGYISTKPNITPVYPFIDAGVTKQDVYRILEDSGIGLPEYYQWRSRSGCYFCFYQQRNEWLGLLERHPALFDKAQDFEKSDPAMGESFTWVPGESLDELRDPERQAAIRAEAEKRAKRVTFQSHRSLADIFDEDDGEVGCAVCHL